MRTQLTIDNYAQDPSRDESSTEESPSRTTSGQNRALMNPIAPIGKVIMKSAA